MKKFFCSTILVFAVALICAACGSTEKKGESDAVSKSEEVKNEKEESEAQEVNTEKSEATDAEKGNNESNDWITEWIKNNSSDDEICAVGEGYTHERGRVVQEAQENAQMQLCRQIATGNSFSCNLPPVKMKGIQQSGFDDMGMITAYALVCIDRKDLEGNKEESEEKASETDNTDETDKTDEDKVVQ